MRFLTFSEIGFGYIFDLGSGTGFFDFFVLGFGTGFCGVYLLGFNGSGNDLIIFDFIFLILEKTLLFCLGHWYLTMFYQIIY
ncbi:MAG: hypothetical protein MJB14_17630 [Spirochaetes bacterium]|nr:hypothetical protein [Spirochaetota bacterium]